MFQQAPMVSMMVAHSRGRLRELLKEGFVDEKAIDQSSEVGVLNAVQNLTQSGNQSFRVGNGGRQKVLGLNVVARGGLDTRHNELSEPLKELYLAFDHDVITRLKGARDVVGDIPQSRLNGAGAVAHLEMK